MFSVKSNDSIETQHSSCDELAGQNYDEATPEISLETDEKDEKDTDNIYKENLSQDQSKSEKVIIHQPTSNNFNASSEQDNNNFNAEAFTTDLEANLSMVTDGDKEYIRSSVVELDPTQSKKNKSLIQYCPRENTIGDGISGQDNQPNRNMLRLELYNKILEVDFPEEKKLEVFKNEVLPSNNFMEEDIENNFDILQLEFPGRFRNIHRDRKIRDMELLFIAQRSIVKKILNDESLFKG